MPDKKSTLLFYANGSSRIGAGHVMRLLAVAQAAMLRAYSTHFIYRHCDQPLLVTLADNGIKAAAMGTHSFAEMIVRFMPCGLFLDDYELTDADWQDIKMVQVPVAALDDQISDAPLPVDLVINPSPDCSQTRYQSRAPGAILCLGPAFTILRKEFTENTQAIPEINRRNHILVTLGGADVKGLAVPVVTALLQHLPNAAIDLVIGGLTRYNQVDLDQLTRQHANLKLHININNMALVMRQAGLAFSAAGGTLGELASQGVPTLVLVCADNQLPALMSPLNHTWYHAVDFRGHSKGDDVSDVISQAVELWSNVKLRQSMSDQARKTVDIQGCNRLLDQFEARLGNVKSTGK